tara:strand:+ start:3140 stop:3346 length:207 start_codon:yes stop_codon:yes gene_type:complete
MSKVLLFPIEIASSYVERLNTEDSLWTYRLQPHKTDDGFKYSIDIFDEHDELVGSIKSEQTNENKYNN